MPSHLSSTLALSPPLAYCIPDQYKMFLAVCPLPYAHLISQSGQTQAEKKRSRTVPETFIVELHPGAGWRMGGPFSRVPK